MAFPFSSSLGLPFSPFLGPPSPPSRAPPASSSAALPTLPRPLFARYELAGPKGGATLAALCAQQDAAPQSVGGAAARGALLRHLFSVASLLACDARDALLVTQVAGHECHAPSDRLLIASSSPSRRLLIAFLSPSLRLLIRVALSSRPAAQLRLALLLIERVLDGSKSAALLLSVDLGGNLPMCASDSFSMPLEIPSDSFRFLSVDLPDHRLMAS